MKRNFIVLAVLLWLMTTGTALALSDCLKDPAFCRTGEITTVTCDNTCGDCNDCNTCDKCKKCDDKCGSKATATYRDDRDGNGYWLTSMHAIKDAKNIWIDGHVATIVYKDCKDIEALEKCGGATKHGCGKVLLKTAGYIPCGACPLTYRAGGLACDEDGFYVDITKCRTVTKVVGGCRDGQTFRTTTLPDCPNCGAVVYNHCDEAVGVMIGGGKDGCGCGANRYSTFVAFDVDDRIFTLY